MNAAARRSALAGWDDDHPRWDREGRDWPNRGASSFVEAGGLRWHVQRMGQGPVMLLIHGTGAATHSWRDLMPLLARHFTVVAPDLPGHGFTQAPPTPRLSLRGMAAGLADLMRALRLNPEVAVGHSAGAAILARMCLDGKIAPRGLISLNGALLPFRGVSGHLFSSMAKFLTLAPLVPTLFSWRGADPDVVKRMMKSTGSELDQAGLDFYRRLTSSPGHVRSALVMMANWRLDGLRADLTRLEMPLVLMVGERDQAIPPADAREVRRMVPHAEIVTLPGLGHLAHEEQPDRIAQLITARAQAWRVLAA